MEKINTFNITKLSELSGVSYKKIYDAISFGTAAKLSVEDKNKIRMAGKIANHDLQLFFK